MPHSMLTFVYRSLKFSNGLFPLNVHSMHSRMPDSIPRVAWKLPESFLATFQKSRDFMNIDIFAGLSPDLSIIRTFAQGIDLEQPRHFWAALLLIFKEKLLWCQLNLHILSCGHFSNQNTQIFPGPVNARFAVIPDYS